LEEEWKISFPIGLSAIRAIGTENWTIEKLKENFLWAAIHAIGTENWTIEKWVI